MAVGRRLGDDVEPHHLRGARTVLHHHALLQPFRELAGDDAADHVGGTARLYADHHPDRSLGELLRQGRAGSGDGGNGDCGLRRAHHGAGGVHLHQGVQFRAGKDPVLYLNNPAGISPAMRRDMLDDIAGLNELRRRDFADPEIATRIAAYEMAYKMQTSVPDLQDLSKEPDHIHQMYGTTPGRPSFANNCLLARRLVEAGVRFVQLYINNWDTHANVAGRLPSQCRDIDQPCHALIQDLKQRGLFDETLIIWGGEFGRTIYSQGGLSKQNYGRDHHPRCFTMWMAGGGTKGGTIYGETDDFSYNIVKDPVHIHDFHATVLHLLGFDHERLTYKSLGLDQRLTGVEPRRVIKELLA